ncbi:MAG: DUF1320 domain-containing protein [Desulfobulbus sp.]|jgi:phage gp36-like protein|nr:MAG: DUF1320 domain-containing protein [Desulfobulbus sp.]
MSYATITDIRQWIDEDVLIQLTDDADAGTTDADVVATALAAASVEIDGYLGGRYALPLASPPAVLTKLAVDIGGWLLHVRRDVAAPAHWQARHDNAIKFLEKIATGKISLGADDPAGTGAADRPAATSGDRIFSTDTLAGY